MLARLFIRVSTSILVRLRIGVSTCMLTRLRIRVSTSILTRLRIRIETGMTLLATASFFVCVHSLFCACSILLVVPSRYPTRAFLFFLLLKREGERVATDVCRLSFAVPRFLPLPDSSIRFHTSVR